VVVVVVVVVVVDTAYNTLQALHRCVVSVAERVLLLRRKEEEEEEEAGLVIDRRRTMAWQVVQVESVASEKVEVGLMELRKSPSLQ